MATEELPLPRTLLTLVVNGFWPSNHQEALAQNLKSLVPADKIQIFAPEETMISFYPPPFRSLSYYGEHGWDLSFANPDEVDTSLTLILGDFGIGSDTLLALDYRQDITNPAVMCQRYSKAGTHWIEVAPTFEDFARMIFQ